MAANITFSVDNSNLFTLTNNSLSSNLYTLERATCEGNTITYVSENSDGTLLPSNDIEAETTITYQFVEDGLYRLTYETNILEVFYVRVTGNIEACRRALDKEFICTYTDECSMAEKNRMIQKLMLFNSYRTFLYGLLNQYQQQQSLDELLAIPDADKLTICQYFCLLQDICGNCISSSSYSSKLSDCGCGS